MHVLRFWIKLTKVYLSFGCFLSVSNLCERIHLSDASSKAGQACPGAATPLIVETL
jgi:hypothetical protein